MSPKELTDPISAAITDLRRIKAFDQALDDHEEAPTGDDYNTVVAIALDVLDKLEAHRASWMPIKPEV